MMLSKIRIAAGALALALAGVSVPALSQDSEPDRVALAEQIVESAYPVEVREQMFMAVVDQMEAQTLQTVKSQMGLDADALAVLEHWQAEVSREQRVILRKHIPMLIDAWAKSYATIFSKEELEDILAFVRTDTGKSFMLRSTDLLSEPAFAAANQAYMDEAMAVTFEHMPDLMDDLIAGHEEEQAGE